MTDELSAYAAEPIEFDEDDIGEEEFEPFSSGAPSNASTWQHQAKTAAGYGNIVAQQALSRLGNVAQVANFSQTGNFLTAAQTGVSGALAPVVAVTGPIGLALALIDSGFSGYSALKTYRHIKQLEHLLQNSGLASQAKPGTKEAIIFCCKKKNKKLKRKGLGCIPVLGSICNSAYTAGRSIYKRAKGTRGVERRQQASVLWQNTLLGDPLAIAACKEILGENVYGMIQGLSDGHLVLKKKLRSL